MRFQGSREEHGFLSLPLSKDEEHGLRLWVYEFLWLTSSRLKSSDLMVRRVVLGLGSMNAQFLLVQLLHLCLGVLQHVCRDKSRA